VRRAQGPKEAATGAPSTPRVLCFYGQGAAALARAARPLDLLGVAAAANAGVYAALPDGLGAFAADVRGVCATFAAAAQRPKTPLAQRLAERRAPDVAAAVLKVLDAGCAPRLAEARAGRPHAAAGAAEARPDANGGAAGKPAAADALARCAPARGVPRPCCECRRALTAAARAGRPFVWPWQGCAACWEEEDTRALLLCDRCDAETHTYCLDPPLRDIPPGARSGCAAPRRWPVD